MKLWRRSDSWSRVPVTERDVGYALTGDRMHTKTGDDRCKMQSSSTSTLPGCGCGCCWCSCREACVVISLNWDARPVVLLQSISSVVLGRRRPFTADRLNWLIVLMTKALFTVDADFRTPSTIHADWDERTQRRRAQMRRIRFQSRTVPID